MEISFTENIDAIGFHASESELTLGLADMSASEYQSFAANITGPHCSYARTLPATCAVPECICLPDASKMTQQLITDPCYWTPRLPYLYDCQIDIKLADETNANVKHTLGFRRWEVDGQNFLLERKRSVLRGVIGGPESKVDLAEAHDAEMCVVIDDPSESFLQRASEVGVMVVADIRRDMSNLTSKLLTFSWQPSVGLVLPKMDACYVPHSQHLAASVNSIDQFSPTVWKEDWVKTLFVELSQGERPPSTVAKINKPVIAIRRDVDFADLHEARTACDRLQAELAPEFNLAGYFVAP